MYKNFVRPKVVGKNHPNWKGGKRKDTYGYILIYMPEHPFSNNRGYVKKHRLVMEEHLGWYLKPTEYVHHINNNLSDNRLKNLIVFNSNSAHLRFHHNPNNVKPEEIIFDGRKLS